MKYNTNKKMTRGAKRTLNDFMCTMFTMLSEKNFEEITVGELCKCANYPRACLKIKNCTKHMFLCPFS